MANARNRTLRRAATLAAVVALLAWLLWPLTDHDWAIEGASEESPEKRRYLEAERVLGRARNAPRVILIVADDLARTDVSLYGARHGAAPVATPAIDSIGREGATFTQASATATICAPSRAGLLTGRYQQRYGFELQPHTRYARNRLEYLGFRYFVNTDPMSPVTGYGIPPRGAMANQGLPASEITLAELLRARGYQTSIVGKWHLGYDREFSPLNRGFDEHYGFYEAFSLFAPIGTPGIVDTPIDDFSDKHMWRQERGGHSAIVRNDVVVQEDEYLTFRFAEEASDYIREHADEPFFLYVPFSAPHTPLQAPEEYVERLAHIADPIRRTYAAMIATLDDAVADILETVEAEGIADETMIIFTSDNGGTSYLDVTDNGPLAGGKFTNFEGGTAVPFMIRHPAAIPERSVVDEPVSLLDVFATVDAATRAGSADQPGSAVVARPSSLALDGVNLIPHVQATPVAGEVSRDLTVGPIHDAIFFRSIYNKAVRAGRWKLIVTEDGAPDVPEGERRVELYNLEADPSEQVDVASQHPDVVADLLARLAAWEAELPDPKWPPVMHFWHDIWGKKRWFAI
jgi:arylsulfatase A-like enzyme